MQSYRLGLLVLLFLFPSGRKLKFGVHQQVFLKSWAHDFLKYIRGHRRHARFSIGIPQCRQTGSSFSNIFNHPPVNPRSKMSGHNDSQANTKKFILAGQEGFGRGRAVPPVSFGAGLDKTLL
ncbi:hypothetical protein GE21DRAFT_1077578 [Neurospora crassa]|nr:hypothetical protein GE21DRAFT_1077578 [Neurospora crassa]